MNAPWSDWSGLDIDGWRAQVARTSAVDGVTAALAQIEELNPTLNAFSEVCGPQALAAAARLDALPESERGPLHGVPFAVKDEIDLAGFPTTFGTHANVRVKWEDSEIVAKLKKAGAIPIGKTRMPEFGAWPVTYTDHAGATRNPFDLSRTPGGSSGGTAAAVAAGIVPFGLGGDGGGSIRIPAAHCGLVGLKPQRGRVSTSPYPSLWLTLGTPGALTRTVADAAKVYDIISTTAPQFERALENTAPLKVRWTTSSVSPVSRTCKENAQAVRATAALLEKAGYDVRPLEGKLPEPTFPFLALFFASIKEETSQIENLPALDRRSRTLSRLARMTPFWMRVWAISHGERLAYLTSSLFDDCDLLLTPTTAARPGPADELKGKGVVGSLIASIPSVSHTLLWNLAGNPAAAIPVGEDSAGLPLSVQLVGPTEGEALILRAARDVERLSQS